MATTYEGYTLPYYLVAALDIGALVTCVLSGLGLILYVFVHPSKRFPRLNHMRTRVAKIVVSNVLRVMAIVVIPQFALYVPGMYVGRTIGSPYTYALVAMPSMWIILSIALELYQTLSDTKKASMLSGHDFVELGAQGAHLDTEAQGSYEDMDPANPQFQEHLDDNLVAQQLNIAREQVTARIAEGASRSNAGMRIGKFAIMVVIGLTMFIIVCNSDDFLVFQKSTMPYMIGLAVMMLAGAIYTVADFLLENVCQPTGLQRTLPRKRFGALLVMVFLHNLFFAVFLSLALLAFYMPQVREHGLAYKPDIVGPNDVAALHGVSGMFAVAFLSALVGLMQCTIYKYVHGVAWIFVINAGLWGVALAGQRSMIQNVTLGSSIVISAFMWLILNQLHTMMSGMRTISKKFSASYARVNGDGAPVGGGDEDEDAGEADEFPYENDEYQLDNLDPMAAVSSAPAAGSFNVAPQQFDTSNPLNASGLHLTKAQQARQMAIERMASTAIGRGPGRQNGGETSAASDSDGASVRF